MGKYSTRGWQYWPDRREGQYRTRELNITTKHRTRDTMQLVLTTTTIIYVAKRVMVTREITQSYALNTRT